MATQTGGVTVNTTPVSGEFYETPQSLQCMYGLVAPQAPGCDPNVVTTTATTGARAIAIVDAYDNPTAASDLATFSSQFNLPAPTSSNFSILYGSGTAPASSTGTGWDLEASLDIEWAHAMAPKATIFLVEAASNSFVDLFQAVAVASQAVANAGGGEVSMSYGGAEFSGETSYDSKMTTASVVYFASSGDNPGTEYPCTSPNVVCVGGTTNNRNPVTGKWEGEMAWNETGGGSAASRRAPTIRTPLAASWGPTAASLISPLSRIRPRRVGLQLDLLRHRKLDRGRRHQRRHPGDGRHHQLVQQLQAVEPLRAGQDLLDRRVDERRVERRHQRGMQLLCGNAGRPGWTPAPASARRAAHATRWWCNSKNSGWVTAVYNHLTRRRGTPVL